MEQRDSSAYKPQNDYIISVQLTAETRQKLAELCAESGYSMSKMIRELISGARVRITPKAVKDLQDIPT